MLDWQFRGIYGEVTDASVPANAALTSRAIRAKGLTLQVGGGGVPAVSTFDIDVANQLQDWTDLTQSEALAHGLATPGNPKLTMDPAGQSVAGYDAYGKLLSGSPEAVSIGFTDVDGNTLSLAMAAAQRTSTKPGTRSAMRTDEVEFELQETSSGSDTLVLTAVDAA